MDESQSIILLAFVYNWSISSGLRLKTSIVDPDLASLLKTVLKQELTTNTGQRVNTPRRMETRFLDVSPSPPLFFFN